MEKSDKVYASQQLVAMLPPLALKVLMWFLNWQSREVIKLYEKQVCKMLKISEEELNIAVQTLINHGLISVSRNEQIWIVQLEKEKIQKYYNVPLDVVKEHDLLPMAKEITWNVQDEVPTAGKMSREQIMKTILMLQAQLKEQEQVAKMVETVEDDLPW